jgi:hypothetical protein
MEKSGIFQDLSLHQYMRSNDEVEPQPLTSNLPTLVEAVRLTTITISVCRFQRLVIPQGF